MQDEITGTPATMVAFAASVETAPQADVAPTELRSEAPPVADPLTQQPVPTSPVSELPIPTEPQSVVGIPALQLPKRLTEG